MYNQNSIKPIILQDKKNGKAVDWQGKKSRTLELSDSYARLEIFNKASNTRYCTTDLAFKVFEDGTKKLHSANFCRVRLCPMCAWRRSLKIFGQVSRVMDHAMGMSGSRFLFLTLTCKNIEAEQLAEQLDTLFYAYKKLMLKTKVKKAVKGWFRALEVTYNKTTGEYHPHFHVVLMVDNHYFTNAYQYINQAEWTDLWQSAMKVDYKPVVDIRAFKDTNRRKTAKSVAEASKYAVKDSDFLIRDKDTGEIDTEATDKVVYTLDYALANRRLCAFGGDFKKIHKKLNFDDAVDGDLVNTNNLEDELREDLQYIIQRFKWRSGAYMLESMELAPTPIEEE